MQNPQHFQIPDNLQDLHVADLGLSVRSTNALRRSGFERLGQLNGLSVAYLLDLNQVGPRVVAEVANVLSKLNQMAFVFAKEPSDNLAGGAGEVIDPDPPPGYFSEIRVGDLVLRPGVTERLTQAGYCTLADVWRANPADLARQIDGLSVRSAQTLASELRILAQLSPDWLRCLARGGEDTIRLPSLSVTQIGLLSLCVTVDDELDCVLDGVPDRRREMILRRWGARGLPQPTLDSLATEIGITRERARQIIAHQDGQLQESRLQLPLATAVVQQLECAGGALPGPDFRAAASASGLVATEDVLYAFPHLSSLGVIPKIRYVEAFDFWLTPPGEDQWLQSGKIDQVAQTLRMRFAREARRTGAVPEELLAPYAPFGIEHAISLALGKQHGRARRISGYIVPEGGPASAIVQAVYKMLAVTPTYSLQDVYSGLKRSIRHSPPPLDVLEAVLSNATDLIMSGGMISARVPVDRTRVLSRSERVAVDAFERHDGALLSTTLDDEMERAGFSTAMSHMVMRAPFLRQPMTGIYVLRGRNIALETLQGLRKVRRDTRRRGVVTAWRDGDDRLIVRYRLTRFSLSGVLARPPHVDTGIREWRARLGGGHEEKLKMKNGFLWSIRKWLTKENAAEGDQIRATFYTAEALVEMELLPKEVSGA